VCGVFCAAFTWFLVLFSTFCTMKYVLYPWFGLTFWGYFHGIIFNTLAWLGLISHARAMLSNPGAVPFNAKPVDPAHYERQCHRCNNFKPERAHHCSVCNRCVVKMDHHCPWVYNCVGLANPKFFLLFLVYVFSICAYALCLIGWRFFSCLGPKAVCDTTASQAVLVMVTTVIAVMFGLFTMCMFFDQLNVVLTNQTQIDRMKGIERHDDSYEVDEGKQVWSNLGEVFGGDPAREGFKLTWLLPTPIAYPNPERLTGFCFRDVPRPRTMAEMEMV